MSINPKRAVVVIEAGEVVETLFLLELVYGPILEADRVRRRVSIRQGLGWLPGDEA